MGDMVEANVTDGNWQPRPARLRGLPDKEGQGRGRALVVTIEEAQKGLAPSQRRVSFLKDKGSFGVGLP